ncbi:hypothetical protein C8E03_103104 [Lachnotalea glycerini]|uniref:Uncharacterized protein n=1 Tax=Lachnotalea glycerini TaxID=1763509 RepID=A0A318ESL2_9FIRM|nr:hypothetical protein C8E03_103104 [Lachnotalea glycerini]
MKKKLLLSFLIFIIFSIILFIIQGQFIEEIYFGFPIYFLTIRNYIEPIYKGISVNLFNFFINIILCYFIYKLAIWLNKKLNIKL